MNNLTIIANKHRTDKGTEWFEKHSYTEIYQSYIPENNPCALLEIGIYHGDSIRMWKEYNSKIDLYVIDNNAKSLDTFDHNLCKKIFLADQGDRENLKDIVLEIGEGLLDFVVDDGSHQMAHHHISLAALLPCVRSGGTYFIEDLHTCDSYEEEIRTTTILQNFIKTNKFSSRFLKPNENEYISNSIASVEFFNSNKLVKIVKK
jgi:cephalosporin hydroxylase